MTYKCVQELLGDGGETTVRSSDILVLDEDEIYRNTKSPTPLFKGGRVVTNLLDEANDFSGWTENDIASNVYSGGNTKITSSATTDPLVNNLISTGVLADRSFIWSVWLWTDSGQPTDATLYLYDYLEGDIAVQPITLTTAPQRFVVGNSFGASETDTTIVIRIDLSTSATGYLYSYKGQLEESTGRSDLTTPSEYVETSGAELTDIYNCTNGNSVDGNGVVTDAVGTKLTDQPYQHYQPAATNVLLQSRTFSTTWVPINSPTLTRNQVGIDGQANTAWTISDGDAVNLVYVYQDVSITSSTNTHTAVCLIKKDTDTTRFPKLIFFLSGGTAINYQIFVNTQTGVIADRIGYAVGTSSSRSVGDFWEITMELTDNASGNTSVSVYIFPAGGTTWSAIIDMQDATATGSAIFDNCGIYLSKTIEDVKRIAPIVTTTASVTTNEAIYTWDAGNHDDTEGGYYLELNWTGGDQDILLFGGTAILYISSGVLTLDDGTNTATIAITTGERQIGVAFGSTSMRVNVDDTWGTAGTYDTAFPAGAITSEASIRELKFKANTYADAQTWIDGEMT